MFARVARYEIPEGRIQDASRSFTEAGKEIEDLEGFERGYVLADGDEGLLFTITLWTSRAAMEASGSRAASLRRRAAGAVDGGVQSVQEYEVVAEQVGRATVS